MSVTPNRINDIEDKIDALEESLSAVKKVTPVHDITWYVKWISVGFVFVAVLCRSIEEVPKIYDVVLSFIGTCLWWWVGILWKDRALIVLNSVLCFILAVSTMRFILS